MFKSTTITWNRGRSRQSHPALLALTALMILPSACVAPDDPRPIYLDSTFGNAVRQNIAAQVINPEAAGPDESDRVDGQTAERALDSLRTRSVKADPESLIISAGGGN